jgi:hypothetical protein
MMRRHLVSSKYLLPTRHRDKQIAIPWNIRLYNEHEVREVSTVSLVGHRSLDVNTKLCYSQFGLAGFPLSRHLW